VGGGGLSEQRNGETPVEGGGVGRVVVGAVICVGGMGGWGVVVTR